MVDLSPAEEPETSLPPSPFADKRGGPAVYSGVGYQTAWATSLALSEVLAELTDPGRACVLRLEPRTLLKGGQRGFDVGLDRGGAQVRHEAKVKPSKDDVLELVQGLPALLDARTLPEVVLVAGAAGAWFTALSDRRDNAVEALDEGHFAALVRESGDARRQALMDGLGSAPWPASRLLGPPLLMPPDALDAQVRLVATVLAGDTRAQDLITRCASRLDRGATARESLSVSVLAGELESEGLLRPVLAVPEADDRVLRATAVLSACGSPLPILVLAPALGLSPDGLMGLLRRQIDSGEVRVDGGGLSRPMTAFRVPPSHAGEVLAHTLGGLIRLPAEDRATAVAQAFNAYLLCRVLVESRPDLVAMAFHAYDKCVKGTGSLLLVSALAQMSLTAITRLARDAGGDANGLRRLLWFRGHAQICGTTWVYQRVGLHDRAAEEMEQARRDGEEHGHPDNVAFADKCQGRISRLRGEQRAAAGDHEGAALLYAQSVRELVSAHAEFDELVRAGETHYDDEPGECLSLAARTCLSAEDLDEAEDFSRRAHEALSGVARPSKAVADHVLLDVELRLARLAQENGEAGSRGTSDLNALRDMAEVCRAVIGEFTVAAPEKPELGVNVGESEIRGRAQRTLAGILLRLGDRGLAADSFDAAAVEFGAVEQTALRYECALLSLESRGVVPERLTAVLDRTDAPAATRVEAHRLYVDEGGDTRSVSFVEGIVRRADELAGLRQHKWGESAA